MATSTRRRAPAAAARPPRATTTASVDSLADQLGSRLKISKPKPSLEQVRLSAMRSVNSASQALSTVVQSGWKRSDEVPPPKQASPTLAAVSVSALAAAKHLAILREDSGGLDVERAAGSVLGKLVALEVYDLALSALADMHPRLCSLLGAPLSRGAIRLDLLSIPTPSPGIITDSILLTLTSSYLAYALTIFTHTSLIPSRTTAAKDKTPGVIEAFADILTTTPTLLSWLPFFSSLPVKHTDSVLARAYTALTRFSATCKTNPRTIFIMRMYGLTCLLHTSPGTVEPNTFWDQATRFGGAFIKSLGTSLSEDDATQSILSLFSDLATRGEKRVDGGVFLSGRGFVEFCEYWMAFAKRAGEICTLDRIAASMQGMSLASSSSSKIDVPSEAQTQTGLDSGKGKQKETSTERDQRKEKERSSLEGARICATLVQMTAILEKKGHEDLAARARETKDILKNSTSLPFLLESVQTPDDELRRVGGKVDRALERMRRAGIKLIEGATTSIGAPDDGRDAVRVLLETTVDILCCSTAPSPDLTTRSLDTLFVLARTGLNALDPRTYVPAHDCLTKAVAIIDIPDNSDAHASPSADKANYVRCVSGAFHNLAAILYQGGRHGAAIGFLKEACRLGVRALDMRRCDLASSGGAVGNEDGKLIEGWKQLEDQLYRRWELLAVCYSKIGDRKSAFGAFVECIKAFPYADAGFAQRASGVGLDAVFAASSATKQLATIIERVSHLGVSELLLEGGTVSLRSAGIDDASITGALIEQQLECLEGSRAKEGVRGVIAVLLRDALEIYSETDMPVRRARIYLKCLDLAYHMGPDGVVGLGDPQAAGQEVERLLQCENLSRDAGLAPFSAQYRASAHLWLALHAHRRADADQTSLIAQHVEGACSILSALVSGAAASTTSPRAAQKKPPRQTASASKTATNAPVLRRRGNAAAPLPPVTPKVSRRKALQPVSLNTSTPPRSSAEVAKSVLSFDNFEKLLALLQSTARILGLLTLLLFKIRILGLMRRLCEYHLGTASDGYILASADLALEFVKLGKTKRASTIFGQALQSVRSGQASDEACAAFYLRFSESLAVAEDVPQSSGFYCEAVAISGRLETEEKGMSTLQRVQTRVRRLEKAAMASHTFALIQRSKEDPSTSLDGMLQSLRLWNRAADTLARLRPSPSPSTPVESESNPFEVPSSKSSTTAPNTAQEQATPAKLFPRRPAMDGLEWRVSEGLLTTLFALSQMYLARGSPREAEYFAQQAHDLAESLNTPAMVSRALAKKGEVQLHQGKLEEAHDSLSRAGELLCNVPGIDTADVRRLRGNYNERIAEHENAQQLYEETINMLVELDHTFTHMDGGLQTSSIAPRPSLAREGLVPELLASVLRQHIWILRDDNGDAYTALLEKFLSLPHSSRTKAQENALMAKLNLHHVYGRFRADMFLNSLTESTIALPMGMSGRKDDVFSTPTQDILKSLDDAEKLFWENLTFTSRIGHVPDIRDAAVSLALIRAFQTSLGKSGPGGPNLAAGLLDISSAITLRRDMLDAIQHKFPAGEHTDDLQWPLVTSDGMPLPVPPKKRARFGFGDSPISDDGPDGEYLEEYWESLRLKYRSHVPDASSLLASQMTGLPSNWTVVHINVTEDRSSLFISRQQGGDYHNPLIFCVPLKGRRDNGSGEDDEEHLTFEDALEELEEIVRLSDAGTRAAVHVKNEDQLAKATWWKERGELDTRMRELLENIEFCWLGAFKTILSSRPPVSPQVVSELKIQFEKLFQRSLHLQDPKAKSGKHKKSASQSQTTSHVKIDDALIECFSTLSPKCRDEELEDLVYFILDLYQFHGVPVAIAEVDVVQVVVDLRAILEEHAQQAAKRGMSVNEREGATGAHHDEHTFLILDKNVQGLPWESIPVLRGRSVSRIPCVDFLHDRVEMARWKQEAEAPHDARDGFWAHAVVDPHKGYFILNPSGDLGRTEGRFKDWAKDMEKVGWQGVIGHAPSEQQFLDALRTQDLVVYFGHGGGEQYVRSHKIRNLPNCAATMLWGCSSGALRDMGDFDRVGTPYNYMLAGCPTLVANLWDVTDRDIDKFSESVFQKLHITGSEIGKSGTQDGAVSVVAAVAQSRDSCKLKYLTGAAPIVYGIPFYL